LLACELGYLTSETHDRLQAQVNEVQKMLGAFHRRLAVNG
jgi:hypothetical protein